MSEDFTLYRGEDGVARVVQPRCPHRGMQLSVANVEGDGLRCFYHGWRFAGDGQCAEQPPEPKPFCSKIRLRTYPTREYLGLIFSYLGDGEPPALPRYPSFDEDGVFLHFDSYLRPANFFNNLENVPDISHLAYAHAHVTGTWDNYADGPSISVEPTSWGLKYTGVLRKSGRKLVLLFGMPNIVHTQGNVSEVDHREFMAWRVPIEDDQHMQVTVVAMRGKEKAEFDRYLSRQMALRRQRDLDREQLTRQVLSGEIHLDDIDPDRVHMLLLEDDIAQAGCGLIDRHTEQLGRSDVGVIAIRKLWLRELTAMANGEQLTAWAHDPSLEPMNEF